jgi:hypothetical protein
VEAMVKNDTHGIEEEPSVDLKEAVIEWSAGKQGQLGIRGVATTFSPHNNVYFRTSWLETQLGIIT